MDTQKLNFLNRLGVYPWLKLAVGFIGLQIVALFFVFNFVTNSALSASSASLIVGTSIILATYFSYVALKIAQLYPRSGKYFNENQAQLRKRYETQLSLASRLSDEFLDYMKDQGVKDTTRIRQQVEAEVVENVSVEIPSTSEHASRREQPAVAVATRPVATTQAPSTTHMLPRGGFIPKLRASQIDAYEDAE